MQNYSEKELLMLSGFVYLPVSTQDKSINEILDTYRAADGGFTETSVKAAGSGGGMSSKEVATLFSQMDAEARVNPSFGEISAARKLDGGNVRAVLYTNPTDDNPVLVFRGTGGSEEAWRDNVLGSVDTETDMQKLADDFVKYECAGYSDITVTGHSKGGNLASYVTVMQSERVNKCVSFDGQGFSNDFHAKHKEEIKLAEGKIKSVSAYNDFVNILLTSVAGEAVFVENTGHLADAHSPLTILVDNEYDENGDFTSFKDRALPIRDLQKVTNLLADGMGIISPDDGHVVSALLGRALAKALSIGSFDDFAGFVYDAKENFSYVVGKKMSELSCSLGAQEMPLVTTNLACDFAGMYASYEDLMQTARIHEKLLSVIEEIKGSLGVSIAAQLMGGVVLSRIEDKILRNRENVQVVAEVLGQIIRRYEEREENVCELVSSDFVEGDIGGG